jgi:peptidoglycan/LPS O-acetylase OafA/YrhL
MIKFIEKMLILKKFLALGVFFKKILFAPDIENISRFDVLDGFRGILAISVVLQHTSKIFKMTEEYKIFNSLGTFFGVPSFFVLSSFLLTNKLFEIMMKSNGHFSEIQQIINKYLLRRFFRIYIPFFILCCLLSMGLIFSKRYSYSYASWYDLVTLKKTGANHLWTVLPEVKYYLFIPIFTFITYKLQKFFIFWISAIIIVMFCVEVFDIYGLKCWVIPWPRGQNLLYVFELFLNGSLLGLIYYKIINSTYEFNRLKKLKFLLSYFTFIYFIYGIKLASKFFSKKSLCDFKFSIYWSFLIFLLLFEEQDCFTEILNLKILKKFGKYSFGIYLLHYDGFPIIEYLRKNGIMNKSFLEIIIIELMVSFSFGFLFFHCVEHPSMNFGNYLIKKLYNSNNENLDPQIKHVKKFNAIHIISNILFCSYFILIIFFIFRT